MQKALSRLDLIPEEADAESDSIKAPPSSCTHGIDEVYALNLRGHDDLPTIQDYMDIRRDELPEWHLPNTNIIATLEAAQHPTILTKSRDRKWQYHQGSPWGQ